MGFLLKKFINDNYYDMEWPGIAPRKVLSIVNGIIAIREEASIWEGLLCADGQAALGPIGITRDNGAGTITITLKRYNILSLNIN